MVNEERVFANQGIFGRGSTHRGQKGASSVWRRRICLSRDAPALSMQHMPLGGKKRAEFTPQLTSPKFLAGLAIWHFLTVLTARLGNGLQKYLSAVPPWLCPRRGAVPRCRRSPPRLICKERWAADGRSSSSLSPFLTPLHAAGKTVLRMKVALARNPPSKHHCGARGCL